MQKIELKTGLHLLEPVKAKMIKNEANININQKNVLNDIFFSEAIGLVLVLDNQKFWLLNVDFHV